jgi:hypothetical protein
MSFEVCNDGHRCLHGSVCVESDKDEGAFDCDCTQTDLVDSFEGLSCEHQATVYCNDDNAVSRTSFCTNGGTCRENVTPESAHIDCICLGNYKGSHCQFTINQKVPSRLGGEEISSNGYKTSDGDGLKTGVTVFIVLILISIVAAFGFFVIRKKFKNKLELSEDVAAREQVRSPELQLDADGAILQTAISEGSGVNSPMSNGMATPRTLDMNDGAYKSPESIMEGGEEKSAKERAMSPPPPGDSAFEIGSPPENHNTSAAVFEIGSPPEANAMDDVAMTPPAEAGVAPSAFVEESPPVAPAIEVSPSGTPEEPEEATEPEIV